MSDIFLLLRVVASLAIVIGVVWFSARVAIRQGLATSPKEAELHIRSRLGLVKGAQVIIVRHGDADLVLGVTSENVSLLRKVHVSGSASGAEPTADEPQPQPARSTVAATTNLFTRSRRPQLPWRTKTPEAADADPPPDFVTALKDATRKAVKLK